MVSSKFSGLDGYLIVILTFARRVHGFIQKTIVTEAMSVVKFLARYEAVFYCPPSQKNENNALGKCLGLFQSGHDLGIHALL